MTQREKRMEILHKRLLLLAEYLEKYTQGGSNPTFAQFLKMRGVTHQMFIKDLPPLYQNVPAQGYDKILEYSIALHELLGGLHNLEAMEQMAADGNNLDAGMIQYDDSYKAYASDGEKDCGCGCGGECNENADGDDESVYQPSGEEYAQWAQQTAALAAQIAEAKQKRDALMSQTGCKKPLFMVGAKKTEYLNCLANYKAKIEAAKEADRALIRMQLELKRLEALQNKGLSTGAWIGISVGAALLLTTIGVVIYKMNK